METDVDRGEHFDFAASRSVEGDLKATADRQREGVAAKIKARKDRLRARTGLTYSVDNFTYYLGTDSDDSPSDALSNVTRLFGTWAGTGQGGSNGGALIYKLEYRTAVGDRVSTQDLGPELGYAGLFATGYSDSGLVLTNLYWRQQFGGGRGAFLAGQVDTTDYVDVNALANPWAAFTNLAFEQQPTYAGPAQGLGAAVRWRLTDHWVVLGGVADANADPSDPWESARTLFETGETFKHIGIGWTPDWGNAFNQLLQLTVWQVDHREDAGVKGGHGLAVAVSGQRGRWRPFVRAGYAEDAGVPVDRSVSIGLGYDARGGKDLAGLAVNWGRAPDSSRDQYTLEAFYRYDVVGFLQLTPSIQYVVNPANDPATDDILVFGARVRTVL